MSEIPIHFTGNPPTKFTKAFRAATEIMMAGLKKEILENNGAVLVQFDGNDGLEIRAASNKPELTMKMTIILQGHLFRKKIGLN